METNNQIPVPKPSDPGNNQAQPTLGQMSNNNINSKKTKIYSILGILILLLIASIVILKYKPGLTVKNQAKNEPSTGFVSAYKEVTVPLTNVANYAAIKAKYGLQLTAAQEKFLNDNRFLLIDDANTKFTPGVNFD